MFWARKWFLSHSYEDEELIPRVKALLARRERLHVFPPIRVPVTEFVSERLFDSIGHCHGLVWLDAPRSRASFWVALELAYARRRKMPVRRFNAEASDLEVDTGVAADIPIYISFAAPDEWRIRQIALWAKMNRGFDLWYERQIGILNEIYDRTRVELPKIMEAGGFLVAFPTHWSSTRGNLGNEVRSAFQINPKHVILAWLDDPTGHRIPGVEIPEEQQIFLRPSPRLTLNEESFRREYWPSKNKIKAGKLLPVMSRDLDDLIVRIQWMSQQGNVL